MKWSQIELGNCVDFANGYAFKSKGFTDNKNDIPLIKGENLDKGFVNWKASKYWDKTAISGLEKYIVKPDDVLLAMDRPWVGGGLKYSIIKKDDPTALLVQRVGRLRARENILPQFLKHIIASNDFAIYIKNIMGGVGVPHISPNQIKSYPFNLPIIETQQKIASILSAYDDLIENNLQRINLLEEATQNIYKAWFIDFRFPEYEEAEFENGLPKGWVKKRLEDVYDFQNGYAFYTDGYSHEQTQYVVVDLGNISESGDFMITGKEKYISESLYEDKRRYHLCKYDVVVAMTDMTQRLGILAKVGIIDEGDKYILNQRVGRLRSKIQYINHCYLNASLSDKRFISEMHQKSKGAVQKYFNTMDIVQYEVVLPTEEIVRQFNKMYSPLIEQRIILKFQNQKLKQARDILLPRLMNRTIEV